MLYILYIYTLEYWLLFYLRRSPEDSFFPRFSPRPIPSTLRASLLRRSSSSWSLRRAARCDADPLRCCCRGDASGLRFSLSSLILLPLRATWTIFLCNSTIFFKSESIDNSFCLAASLADLRGTMLISSAIVVGVVGLVVLSWFGWFFPEEERLVINLLRVM